MKIPSIRGILTQIQRPYLVFGLAVFILSASLAVFVQFILLPYLFPGWHESNGLLAGTDANRFHRLAGEMASQIQQQGWEAWELRPEGQSPAGIAAIFYTLFYPAPWVLIPLNAFLHSASALLLARIMQGFLPKWKHAFLTVLPFAFFPSAMSWYTQIHKDGFSIVGILLFLLGWLLMVENFSEPAISRKFWTGCAVVVMGTLCVWLVRPYLVEVIQISSIVLLIPFLGTLLGRLLQKKYSLLITLVYSFSAVVLVLFMTPFRDNAPLAGVLSIIRIDQSPDAQLVHTLSDAGIPDTDGNPEAGLEHLVWQETGWIPTALEGKLYQFALSRERFTHLYPDAASNIDVAVSFHGFWDIIAYVPRAVLIAGLAPFPTDWFISGSMAANTAMRRVSAFEMSGIYASLVFLLIGLKFWGKKLEFWLVLLFCSANMTIYALIVANVGTLYRMRYGFMMTLVALGVASAIRFFSERRASLSLLEEHISVSDTLADKVTSS
jgi:hypothetical protein